MQVNARPFRVMSVSNRTPETGLKMQVNEALGELMQTRNIKKTDSDKKFRSVLAASTLTGDSVRNAAGEDLGKIDEIMIDIPTGRVAYTVLSFGGFLGMGDKLFAVPWSALKVDKDEKCFILNADRQTLERAPGFDKDNWPDMSDQTWGEDISTYYHVRPYWEGGGRTLSGGGGM